jgi:hypothetical protein
MASSVSSVVSSAGTLESEPAFPSLAPRRRRQLGAVGTAVVALGVIAAVNGNREPTPPSPQTAFAERWIGAWNDRDSQALSSMTCAYMPAFVPAGVIEDFFQLYPADRPVVVRHTITGTEPAVVQQREGVQVGVSYELATGSVVQERNLFVRVRDNGDICLGDFALW